MPRGLNFKPRSWWEAWVDIMLVFDVFSDWPAYSTF